MKGALFPLTVIKIYIHTLDKVGRIGKLDYGFFENGLFLLEIYKEGACGV